MRMNFYLKKPESNGESLIYLQARIEGAKIVVSTKETIRPALWDKNRQRVDISIANGDNGLVYINNNLDRIEREAKVTATRMKSEGRLSRYNLRSDLLYSDLKRIILFKNPANRELLARYYKQRVRSLHSSYLAQLLKKDGWPEELINDETLMELKRIMIKTRRIIKTKQHENKD